MANRRPLYRHVDVALLRAAAASLTDGPDEWPDPTDLASCRKWLDEVWSRTALAEAIGFASPTLAKRVTAIRAGSNVADKHIRRATLATARYLLRSIGRPTPFGLFAGVAPVTLGRDAEARWGSAHRAVTRVNTVWLADIIARAEGSPELLDRLSVRVNDLAVRRGRRLDIPHGQNRVSIRYTAAVAAVQQSAANPIRFGALVKQLCAAFPSADPATVKAMLVELVEQGYLITSLRAPFTVTDPLAHLVDQLRSARANRIPDTAPLLESLEHIQVELRQHNEVEVDEQRDLRKSISRRMADLSGGGRALLTADLMLDCALRLPTEVAHEMERAASALLRLTRHPAGEPEWRAYHGAFVDRYGTGTLVPLAEVLNPDAGLGYPPGYPGSILPTPSSGPSDRDQQLLALAWEAISTGTEEIILTDEQIATLADDTLDERYIPPHVELAARIYATSRAALDRGEFTLTVAPARAAGTLTSRFTPLATGSGLAEAYRALPAATQDALRVQMSFGPLYPNAENVCRVPRYLEYVLPLGEHRHIDDESAEATLVTVDDLAITATRDRLYLVSLSRRRVVEPQVFHALALNKQPPALARFLAHLPRAFGAAWYQFDWGPYVNLPHLPQVRYRRAVLFPAQWRLTTADLPARADLVRSRRALDEWRRRWECPANVELRDADRTLRLTLDEPMHAAILFAHVARHGQALLSETAPPAEFGWLDGHVHEIAFPLVTTREPAHNPLLGHLPVVTNTHGHLPGSPDARWLSAKVFTHPERIDEIITQHLPMLLATLRMNEHTEPSCWWLRYHSPAETDHLRLRIRIDPGRYAACTQTVGEWTQRMRQAGMVGRLVLDTYYPEIGRYGHGAAMDAAEDVFVTDSRVVAAWLRTPLADVHTTAFVVANMVGTVCGLLGDLVETMGWLVAHAAPSPSVPDRTVADQAIQLTLDMCAGRATPNWPADLGLAWQARADALATYRKHLPVAIRDVALESLLHMHHNRAIGIDSDSERVCRRLARQAALAWRARCPVGEAK